MTSSSSLYGSVNTQNTQSTNSTSLYGGADTPIPSPEGDLVVRGDLWVLSGNILTTATTGNIFPANATTINLGLAATSMNIGAASGTTTVNNALTAGGTVTAPGADFGNITIGVATDNTITTTTGDLAVTATGSNAVNIASGLTEPTRITRNTGNTATSVRSLALSVQSSGTPAVGFGNSLEFEIETAVGNTERAGFISVVSTDVTPTSEDFSMSFGLMTAGATADAKMTLNNAGDLQIDGNLTVDGTDINIAQGTNILYSENNSRFNRPTFQSSTGNISGLRVRSPNTGSSAQGLFSVTNSSDELNAEFLQMGSRGSALTNTFRFLTGKYTAGVVGPANKSVAFTDDTNTYATVNPAGPTIGTDLTTKTYVDAAVAGGVTSITGTANQVIASSATGAVTLSLPQSIATTSNVTFADVIVGDDLTVQGNNVNLAQATIIGYDENNTRVNRPQIQSTTGNSSGLRILAPNATTSAQSNMTVFGSNDIDNGEFLSIRASGSTTAPFSIRTGLYTAGVLGASGEEINFVDNTTTYASVNPAGPTNGTDLTTKTYVDALTVGVSSVTGGTHVSASPTTGAVVVSTDATDANTASTIVARDASGNFSAGAGTFTSVATPAVSYSSGALTITGGAVALSGLTLDDYQTTLALDGGVGYGDSLLTAAYNALTWAHTAGGLDIGSVNGTWSLGSDGKTYFPNYNLPYVSGAVNTVLTNDGSGNVTWALPGGGGSTFGNVTVGVDTDQTISTTSGNLVLQTAAGVNAGTITMASGVNGDITLAPNGTGKVIISDGSYVLGQLIATPTLAYTPPANALTTVTGTNGIVVASSTGNNAALAIRYSSGDTTAGTATSANILMAGTSGTSTAPGGIANNQVAGNFNIDGYTAGTSNNFAQQIATVNQGAGTTAITPLQIQGYARQAFTNSVVLTTAVTGASGTGSVATLTFTTQNTAPYVVGQTVAIAGMTPAGYNNAAAVITAATTSSISYANTTTGFTSGGTIAAVNTVTAAGMGFRVRGFANSTNMTVGNRFNFMDLTASTATFKSAAYTFANEVITGSTLTATNYMTLGATVGAVSQDTFSIRNTAGTTTYGAFTSTGTTITGAGLSQITRTTVGVPTVAESRPSMNIQLSRSDQAAPNDQDATGFRYRLNGSNATNYTVADMSAKYRTAGDNEWNLQLANGDQTSATFSGLTTLQSKITATTISAGTASGTAGASAVAAKLTIDATKITAAVPFVFPSYTVAAITAVTGAVGWQVAVSDSPTYAGRMAYWSTTATAAWRYIDDNSAV